MLPDEKMQVRNTMTGEDPEATRPSRRRSVVGAVVAVLAVAAVVLGGLRYLPVLLSGSTQTGPVPTPIVTHVPPPTSSPPAASGGGAPFTPTGFLNTLNRALTDVDRQAFFEHVGPGATDGLNLWWDNMAALGMSGGGDRKSTRLNSSHVAISYAVFCLKKKKKRDHNEQRDQEGH